MITVSAGRTPPVFTAEPQPVPTLQLSRQAFSSGVSSGTFTLESVDTVMYSPKVEIAHIWPTGVPSPKSSRKLVGSCHPEPASCPQPDTQVTHVLVPGSTPAAAAADRQEREDDLVPGRETRRIRADRLDDAAALVPSGERVGGHRRVAGDEVVIGVAQTRGHHLDPQFTLLGIVHLQVDHLERTGHVPDDCASGSHEFSFSGWREPRAAAQDCRLRHAHLAVPSRRLTGAGEPRLRPEGTEGQ